MSSHRIIPIGKIEGLRLGQIIISAMSHAGIKKEDVVSELFYIDNRELKEMVDMFMDYYEREAFKKQEKDDE